MTLRRCSAAGLGIAALAALSAVPSLAQGPSDRDLCDRAREPAESVDACTRLIAAGPEVRDLATTYYDRALALGRLGENARAIEDYDHAILLVPEFAAALAGRSIAYADLGQRDRAWQDRREAARIYTARGQFHVNRADYIEAIRDFTAASALDPENGRLYLSLAHAFVGLRQADRAVQDFDEALRREPTDRNEWQLRNFCQELAIAGFAAEALHYCNDALALMPRGFAAARLTRAYAFLRQGQLDDSLRDYDAVIAANQSIAIAWFGRAVVRARRGDAAGAQTDLAQARHLNPDIDAHAAEMHLTAPTAPPQP
jgi:tetratricopeptide (TPR) repeat protein